MTTGRRVLVSALLLSACATVIPVPVDGDGVDVAEAPARFPDGHFVPLLGPLRRYSPSVVGVVDGTATPVTIDSGAWTTMISRRTADDLGLSGRVDAATENGGVIDIHEARAEGRFIVVDFSVGPYHSDVQRVLVVPGEHPLFLVGLDVLQRYDLLVVADEGLIGFFDKGMGPHRDDDLVLAATPDRWRRIHVRGSAPGAKKTARCDMLVDTGAEVTGFPSAPGVDAGVPADLRFRLTVRGILSEEEKRGHFLLRPLSLDDTDVGTVSAVESLNARGTEGGNVGTNVLLRYETLLDFDRPSVRFHLPPERPDHRDLGPGGVRCRGGCISVAVRSATVSEWDAQDELRYKHVPSRQHREVDEDRRFSRDDRVCLAVAVDPVWAKHKLELLVTDDRLGGKLGGDAITIVVNVPNEGFHRCLPLPRATQALGLAAADPVALRFVRADRAAGADCGDACCAWWSGP